MSPASKVPPEAEESVDRMDRAARQMVKDLMNAEGISQRELAELTGRSQQTVSGMLTRHNRGHSMTLRTYAGLLWALGYEVGESMLEVRKIKRKEQQ